MGKMVQEDYKLEKGEKRNYNIVEHKNVILAFGAKRSRMTKKRLFFTKSIKRMESYIKILYYF
jgi:hypothetical protein